MSPEPRDPIRVFDPHIHLWDVRGTPRRVTPLIKLLGWSPPALAWACRRLVPGDQAAFFGSLEHLTRDYLPADYRADSSIARFDVVGCVHVQAGWEGRGRLGSVGETLWLEALGMGEVAGIVGHADLGLGDRVDEVLTAHRAASERFRGVRDMLAWSSDLGVHSFASAARRSRDSRWRAGYARLAAHRLSFDAWLFHHQLDELADLAAAYPDVPMILCHSGSPVGIGGQFGGAGRSPAERDAVARAWRAGMRRLAERENVWVKLSGYTMPVSGWGYHSRAQPPLAEELAAQLGPLVRFVIDTFGVERCMFASNFPVDKVSASWASHFEAYARIVEDVSREERAALFCDNALRAYRITLPSE
jgi:predicted TIM-barrel fold metal-dependent hydrolase